MLRPTSILALTCLMVACGTSAREDLSETGSAKQRLALFDYIASGTYSATAVGSSADSWVYLNAGETVMIGTCGINESAASGNTFLRLFDPGGVEVASNDNGSSPGCGLASRLAYVAPAAGYYLIRAGCYSMETCSGTVALSRSRGSHAFSASDTNYATLNTFNKQFKLDGGDIIRVSTCPSSAYGASYSGDTYLRLFRQTYGLYSEVSSSDNAAGCGTASELVYMAPAAGYYQVRAGCAASTSCSGSFAVYVE